MGEFGEVWELCWRCGGRWRWERRLVTWGTCGRCGRSHTLKVLLHGSHAHNPCNVIL